MTSRTGHCCHNLSDAECAATAVRHCNGWVEDVSNVTPADELGDRVAELKARVGA